MNGIISNFVCCGVRALILFINESLSKQFENIRIARAALAVLFAGADELNSIVKKCGVNLCHAQIKDGGWVDPEETAWASSLISQLKGRDDSGVSVATQWLKANRINGGGWGKHSRDRARIPTTALVLTLLPQVGNDEDYHWVAREWAKDLGRSVQLSYKAGFYLLVAGHSSIQDDSDLIDRTIKHLTDDQNDDGGFAPWKNHPIGSDPWSTGVVLWGLSKWIDKVDPEVIERALHWLQVTQLPSGYWPYHYLDEGSSYALIGAVSAMRAMASRK